MAIQAKKPNKQGTSQAALRKSERWLRALLEHSYDAIVLASADGKTIFASPSIQRVIGYSPEEYIALNGAELTHPDDLEDGITFFRHIREQPGVSLPLHHTRFRHKDGSWRWIEYTATNLLTDPTIGAIVFNFRDITKHKQLEDELRRSKQQLEVILENIADGIIVYNIHNQIIYANDAAAHLTGFSSVQAMLETLPNAIVAQFELIDEQGHPFPLLQLPHRRVLAGEQKAQAIIGYRKAGTGQAERWSLSTARPVFDEQGKVVLAITIVHDMTERMLAERRKDEFISMASHELKTPVTSLKGFTHILQRRMSKQGDEQGLTYLAKMDRQLNKLTNLISELLDISRMQTGKLAFQTEAFDLSSLVEEIVENLQQTTHTHQLCLDSTEPVQVVGDRERIGQVLINLVTNAIKYSPQADKVIMRVAKDQNYALVSVQDFGIGIAKQHQDKIFERFYQVADPDGQTYPGLGIGLYISQEIITRHGGRIWVESTKGKGSTFYMSLPLTQEAKETSSSDKGSAGA